MAMTDVWLNDSGHVIGGLKMFAQADQWAQEHCQSYRGYEVTDVSDVSLVYDNVASYSFGNEQDALIFMLRWR